MAAWGAISAVYILLVAAYRTFGTSPIKADTCSYFGYAGMLAAFVLLLLTGIRMARDAATPPAGDPQRDA